MVDPTPSSQGSVTSDVAASLTSFRSVVEGLEPEEWAVPTDCPGWDVADVVAHVVTFEAMLDGDPTPESAIDDAHVRNEIGRSNELWVQSWRGRPHDELVAALDRLLQRRTAELAVMGPGDLDALGWSPVGEVPRSRFLQIRVLDVWFHEQDIREAIGRPGGFDPAVVSRVLAEVRNALGYAVGRSGVLADGASVRFDLVLPGTSELFDTVEVAVRDGRGVLVAPSSSPTVTVGADVAGLTRLVGGRRSAAELVADGRVSLSGDVTLGEQVIAGLGYMI